MRRAADPHPENEPKRRQLIAEVSEIVGRQGFLERVRYLDSCVVSIETTSESKDIFLGRLHRSMLENVQWVDVPTIGVVYHPVLTEGPTGPSVKLAIKSKDAAGEVVRLLETVADTCK